MPTATLLKGFENRGKVYKTGDKFDGSLYEIELLARQKFCEPPKAEEPAETPAPAPLKVPLLKGFDNQGHIYHTGDSFEGSAQQVDLLVRQGFVDPKEAKPPEEPHAIDTVPKGTNVSMSSSADAGDYNRHKPPAQETAAPASHKK